MHAKVDKWVTTMDLPSWQCQLQISASASFKFQSECLIKHQTSPDRPKLYELTRTKNQDCKHWVDEGSYRHWEEITSELSKEQPESVNTREIRDAAFQKVLGQRDGGLRTKKRDRASSMDGGGGASL